MNFYDRVAKLVEARSPYSSRPHKPRSGSRSRPTGRGPATDADKAADKAAGDAATATVLKKSAEIAAKKKGDGDVDEWGSGQAVAQKDKRQADREKEIGQKSVPHKFGRSQKVSPTHPHTSDLHKAGEKKKAEGGDSVNASKKKKVTAEVKSGSGDLPGRDSTGAVVGGKPQMTNREETPEETKARKERAANAHKVNKANMQPLPDDDDDDSGAVNASKKKKVNAMKETFYLKLGKGLQEKMKNRPDDDDKLPDGPKAAPKATASNNQAQADLDAEDTDEANTKGPDVDLGDPENKKHADAKARAKELAQQGEKDQETSDSPLNASKKSKLKKKVDAMKEQDKDTEDEDTDDVATQDRLNKERGEVDKEYQSWRAKQGLNASKRSSKKTEDKDWIQKAVNPKHKGYCTPMTKSTCTPARKALAKRFKKAGSKEKKEGGTGWQGKV